MNSTSGSVLVAMVAVNKTKLQSLQKMRPRNTCRPTGRTLKQEATLDEAVSPSADGKEYSVVVDLLSPEGAYLPLLPRGAQPRKRGPRAT